jgi:hypothetical protein
VAQQLRTLYSELKAFEVGTCIIMLGSLP